MPHPIFLFFVNNPPLSVIMSSISLEAIKTRIEKMDKTQHVEIFKILKKYANVRFNENKSGIFINMSYLEKATIDDLIKYISYIDEQEYVLEKVEKQKDEYQRIYFNDGDGPSPPP
jgi:hypothetical protein